MIDAFALTHRLDTSCISFLGKYMSWEDQVLWLVASCWRCVFFSERKCPYWPDYLLSRCCVGRAHIHTPMWRVKQGQRSEAWPPAPVIFPERNSPCLLHQNHKLMGCPRWMVLHRLLLPGPTLCTATGLSAGSRAPLGTRAHTALTLRMTPPHARTSGCKDP